MNIFKTVFAACCTALLLTGCQHGIDLDDLQNPPEDSEQNIATSLITEEEANKELEEIAKQPYPPYTIQGGDSFKVKVYNEEDISSQLSSASLVTPDGYLVMNLIKPVLVKDLTLEEATKKVEDELKRYIKFPQVSLIPEKIIGKQAALYGAVREPGNYTVNSNTRISEFVGNGRGFATGILDNTTVDIADTSNSYIIRNGKILPVNFTEAIKMGNPLHNIYVWPNDIVYIARREDSRVMIMGEIKNPRVLNWTKNMTVMDAIAGGQGLMDDYWGTVLILRRPKNADGGALKIYKVNVDDLFSGKAKNFRLAAGDIVYIPKDALGEYNVFVRKLLPTAQFINLILTPANNWFGSGSLLNPK